MLSLTSDPEKPLSADHRCQWLGRGSGLQCGKVLNSLEIASLIATTLVDSNGRLRGGAPRIC